MGADIGPAALCHGEEATRIPRPRPYGRRNATTAGAGLAISALLFVAVVVAASRMPGGGEGARAVLEEGRGGLGSARSQYDNAEKVMKAALEKAHDYEKTCVCVRCGECRVWSWM